MSSARLVVGLWRAACLTPHMLASKRGADSFRPFVAGCLYALKRGVRLSNGTLIAPILPELASHLPTLRTTWASQAAKQLHSSSHRGLCSLARSIASMEAAGSEGAEARQAFLNCIDLSKDLLAHVRRLERGK